MNTKIVVIGIIVVVLVIAGILIWGAGGTKTTPTPSASETATETASPTPLISLSPTPTPVVQIKTLLAGRGTAAKAGDTVAILYTGKLADGTVFDASSKHGNTPIIFKLGGNEVIPGFDQGVTGMKMGEKRRITIPSALGYGAAGIPQAGIPANATLIFEVERVAIPSPTPTPKAASTPSATPTATK